MSNNRHERRSAVKKRTAAIKRFRQELGGDGLDTFLIYVTDMDLLIRKPLLARAGMDWGDSLAVKRPVCISCKGSFAEYAKPGAFVFATSRKATNAAATSVSAICETCVARLTDIEIDQVCTALLRQLIPGGRFLDPW
jgi:hypothetical protein